MKNTAAIIVMVLASIALSRPSQSSPPNPPASTETYRKACSAEFTPTSIKQRVQEYKDMNGSEYAAPDVVDREATATVEKEVQDSIVRISMISDADLKKVLADNDGMLQKIVDRPVAILRWQMLRASDFFAVSLRRASPPKQGPLRTLQAQQRHLKLRR